MGGWMRYVNGNMTGNLQHRKIKYNGYSLYHCNMDISPTSLALARRGYADKDESHDINHALKVVENAREIIVGEKLADIDCDNPWLRPLSLKAVIDTCLFHDMHDHKYKINECAVSRDELENHLIDNHGTNFTLIILFVIDHMSWSKRDTVNPNIVLFPAPMFHVPRDADWIEAIDVGRCIAYSKKINRPVPEGVIDHIYEKMMHLLSSLYYETSKRLAKPAHEKMMRWLEEAQATITITEYNRPRLKHFIKAIEEGKLYSSKNKDDVKT